MSEPNCACHKFQRLEGAATRGYIAQFLERITAEDDAGATRYRCRECGARWERIEAEGRRPALAQIDPRNK